MRRTFRFAILLGTFFWVALGALPAQAQYFGRNKVQYDQFDFQHFQTEHFEFYLYPEEKQAVIDASRMAERWYRRHSRTFARDFKERKPVIFYANDADFHQTNAISGSLGEGTGGVTESLKERVVMPLTGLYAETDHVLGHELVHSFQYDIGLQRDDSTRFALGLLPLWVIEGTAEYLSVGREDPHTAMWLRDAALNEDLPTAEKLTREPYKYFPYRFGQAYMAYIGGKYGDAAVTNLFKLGGRVGLDSAFVYTLGISADSLSNEWIAAVKENYLPLTEDRAFPDSVGHPVITPDRSGTKMNLAPVVSPDGKYIAYLSERDLFNINLFIADAETGKIVKKLKGTNSDPHFDSIRFISSAGSWSPDGNKFAFITFVDGDNEIAILNWNKGNIERRVSVEGVTAITNVAWSPLGNQIAFSGMDGGISDLYLLDLTSGAVRQLTNDRYGDLQPAWSPDGKTIAFVTDRGSDGYPGTDFESLYFARVRIGLLHVDTGEIDVIRPFATGQHVNPQFSPDGRSLYFISDQDGFKDIYRLAMDSGDVFRVTNLKTGVSGITALSPAMSVAAQSGRMVYSSFWNGTYRTHSFELDETQGEPVVPATEAERTIAGILPPFRAIDAGMVGTYLNDPLTGLPDPVDPEIQDYGAKLQLDYVAPPTIGVAAGGPFGGGVAGGVAFFFSDMLGNHNLFVVAQANGTFKDIGGQVAYLNNKNRLNFGASLGHIPILFGGAIGGYATDPETGSLSQVVDFIRQRIFIDQAEVLASYPLTTTKRFELNAGFTRYGFDFERERYYVSAFGVRRDRQSLDAPDPVYFFQTGAAFVGDYSAFGFTSPIQGGRYRFDVSPYLGSDSFVRLLTDYRRYLFFRPFTFAVRGLHIGNYGAREQTNGSETLFTQEYLGYSNSMAFIRGYNFNTFSVDECLSPDDCVFDDLIGTRLALASAELRIPLFGSETLGLINFPYLPTELAFFADAGITWTRSDEKDGINWSTSDFSIGSREPVVSAGVSTRFNLFGYTVLEVYYAKPFQRPVKGNHFGFQIIPGW